MDIYVQSRGFEQEYDYRWLQIYGDGATKQQLPPISLEVTNLIDSESSSVVLEKLPNEQILLLITGIEPDERVDFLERQIRISVAWVGLSSDESVLRNLAVSALKTEEQHTLTAAIHQAVPLGGEYGFHIDSENMRQLISAHSSTELLASKPPNLTKKIGKNSPNLRNQLAEELKEYQLPTESGTLVIVTGIKKRETLENAGIWRSLSSLVEADEWEEISTTSWSVIKNNWQQTEHKNLLVWLMLLIAIVSYLVEFMFKLISSNKEDEN
ncbi:MAG: hypothetical protein F6K31_16465 [Symploca sp. SIO2G7]|nr:hypothetical protein [Symploca sp. SIO2G7]